MKKILMILTSSFIVNLTFMLVIFGIHVFLWVYVGNVNDPYGNIGKYIFVFMICWAIFIYLFAGYYNEIYKDQNKKEGEDK